MLKGKKSDKKDTYFMPPVYINFRTCILIYSARRQISDCLGMRVVGQGERKIKSA